MFDDYRVVYCRNCIHAAFPQETAPWGTCCEASKGKKTINKKVARTCNKYERKESKEYGKDE